MLIWYARKAGVNLFNYHDKRYFFGILLFFIIFAIIILNKDIAQLLQDIF